jgi:RNA polymerase sigma-70 factor (ECF subfamily)
MTIAEVSSEEDVAAAAIRGDEEAFATIYDRFATRVFNLVLRSVHERSTAEDICQEVWLKAHREIRSLQVPGALRTWLFRMASRACIDYSRSKTYRERGSPEISDEMLEAASHEPEAVALRHGEMRVMWEALAAIPPRQSMALYLKQVDGRSYEEIGRILGCPKSAVETLLFRARQGFARSHEMFQVDPKASCRMIGSTMAVVLDKEGTPFQERAVKAHLSDCRPCRDELGGMKRGAAGYAWLPMLPVGGQALSMALAGSTAGVGAGLGISRIVAMLILKTKATGMVGLAVGTMAATTAVAGAAAGITPSPFDAAGVVQDLGTSVRDATFGGGGSGETEALKAVDDEVQPLLAGVTQPSLTLPPAQPVVPAQGPALPPASQLDPAAALAGLPGLLSTASEGALASLDPLLAFLGETAGGLLEDPLASLQALLKDPIGTVDGLLGDTSAALLETTTNTTATVDDTVDQTTDLVDGLLGEETALTGTVDTTVDQTTDIVDNTLGGLLGDEGILGGEEGLLGGLGGDDGLLGGLGGGQGGEEMDEEEDPGLLEGLLDDILPPLGGGDDEEEDEEPPCVLIILC